MLVGNDERSPLRRPTYRTSVLTSHLQGEAAKANCGTEDPSPAWEFISLIDRENIRLAVCLSINIAKAHPERNDSESQAIEWPPVGNGVCQADRC